MRGLLLMYLLESWGSMDMLDNSFAELTGLMADCVCLGCVSWSKLCRHSVRTGTS